MTEPTREPDGASSSPDCTATRPDGTEDPPQTIGGILKRLGPGLIVAGSIVGSGELIATTAVGAEAGFWLLWIIIIGCVIKVFAQVELGRYSIYSGRTTMDGMNEVPGPRLGFPAGRGRSIRGNWLVWYWLVMFLASLAQLGGIVGGVGQALSISVPITEGGREYNEIVDAETKITVSLRELRIQAAKAEGITIVEATTEEIDELKNAVTKAQADADDPAVGILTLKLAAMEASATWIRRDIAWRTLYEVATSTLGKDLRAQAVRIASSDAGPLAILPVERIQELRTELKELESTLDREKPDTLYDDRIWAAIIAIITAVVLFFGRYGIIQTFSTTMVCLFTLITIGNLISLQSNGSWMVTWDDFLQGLKFQLPPPGETAAENPLRTALFTFGIIGVGASELVTYPYWCIEKGYAKFTGPRDDSEEWAERARGWMRVMRWDAWCSMVVYTFATVAFYLLGAAILSRTGLNPSGTEMIRTLAVMYEPVFGEYAPMLFLFGAFAVLYSTFFVANASHARVFPDALRVFGFGDKTREQAKKWVRIFSVIFPLACLVVYLFVQAPKELVLLSGMMQAIMLPMLAGAALYFRFRRCDPRIAPGKVGDFWLWLSAVGMLIAGGAAIYTKFF